MYAKEEEASSKKHALLVKEKNLANVIFSWSLDDILNGDLYKDQVGKIPNAFESLENYLSSFVYPLLEETRSDICSKIGSISTAPFGKVISLQRSKQSRKLFYDLMVEDWKHSSDNAEKDPYRTKPGDIIAFTEATPGQYLDVQRLRRRCNLGYVTKVLGDNYMYAHFEVRTSKELEVEQEVWKKSLYAVFVTNVTTSNRIWKALTFNRNLDVIKEILGTNSMVQECCKLCPPEMKEKLEDKLCLPSYLNKSQREAIVECIFKSQCDHKSCLELIWGPPGTGKTRTLTVMLWSLLQLKCRTLMCCPTNVAISEVASRVMKLVKDDGTSLCGLGDMLLYGNIDQTAYAIEEICLNYRVERLSECLADRTGWRHCITSMIELLEDCVSKYKNFCDSKNVKDGDKYVNDGDSFLNFIRDSFIATASSVRNCISTIYTHLPKAFIKEHNFKDMVALMTLLDSFESFLFKTNVVGEELKEAFLLKGKFESLTHVNANVSICLHIKRECVRFLRTLISALDGLDLPTCNKDSIEEFCYKMASLIFCTASSSYKLHSVKIYPMKLLIIDEAAQLKECELLVPLQVPSIKHVVLLGDECQLPAFVSSKVSAEAGIGKSLFERLSTIGFSRHLLDTQYRMHPKISRFPNAKFYQNRIMDADIVKSDIYEKCYIPGPMFGSYSFVNISCGREDRTDGHSLTNMVEVAVLLKIIQRVYKECEAAKVKVTVGVVSPYSAQVSEIRRRLGKKYDDHENFKVHIRSIDGFQGGEDDIVIISTVRSNQCGSLGFTSSPQRINVALTRARHCLWILGNEETLSKSDSIWEQLVLDAKVRQCFYNADDDKDLQAVIMEVKKELDQLGDMLKEDSMFFRNARWKLMFSGNFTKSFKKLETETQNLVLLFLSKLAKGWRPKRVNSVVGSGNPTKILKQYKIGKYYIICSVDIYKELWYMQTLKVWEILPLQDIPKMIKRLEHIFQMYTDNYISRCSKRCVEGDLEVPMTWAASENIVQYKSLSNTETGESSNTSDLDGRCLENSKVRESLLLMKFYSLSCGAISNLLSGCDGESLGIPFELTDQERDIVLFNRSSFILGRSGTGKTTVLNMKLFRNDQLYHVASEGYHEVRTDPSVNERQRYESYDGDKEDILRQLFVTVSPKLCYAVREQFSQLRRSVCGGDSMPECNPIQIDDIDEVMHSTDIPDSLYELPPNSYPLIITFQKFLMMLDGTIGISYFDRFPVLRQSTHSGMGKSRSVALETFIRTKEITFEKFDSLYWPHFNKDLTRKLCSLTVFTEIMSVIKGGLQATDDDVGALCQQEFVSLSNNRGSTLSMEKRVHVYKIFTDYEKRKVANGDFDLADLVLDLHRRLKDKRYNGDEMDFVFVDEVQDLSMRQISLFKYICKNVDDGFAFSGDTAQTIAKGINFRFEDIRYLFYREFLGKEIKDSKRNEKGKISSLFQLNYNFRTHAGVLKLAQSVINLICHFFPYSIDFLNPETSLISGESPVLLETGSMDALRILFENTGTVAGNFNAFGAEQVILVRDDCLKKEICDSVGKKALVLTILECKGLEFQDVLLYNFFSSSPFENEWRVIYEYMNDNNMLGSTALTSFPKFDLEKHGILCSELKQLYVAVTRTKQRLWICESSKDFSGPIFDYWKKLCVVKVTKMDDSFIKEMQVESTEDDWRSRGIKLFHENNYEMAMMCFERAGDTYWAKLAEASLYQAAARRSEPNSEMALKYLKKAAEIFDTIGKAESAARLFIEIEEYERAGCIYLNTLPEPKLEKAGECFCLAKCFRQAAKVYASGGLYPKCLSACLYGKLFDMGMQYTQEWRKSGVLVKYKVEINRILQELLQNGAIHYYEQHDYKKMMKFVECFESKDSMRNFLNDFRLHRELLDLEMKWGNFPDAARIAKQIGDSLLEADLLSKCGVFQEASLVMLWYVFSELIRATKRKYSPYHFKHKDDILEKAMSTAKRHSDSFYDFACMEAVILSELKSVKEMPESGLQFVRHWRQNVPACLVKTSFELHKTEQDLLERCAIHHYEQHDYKKMMNFVESFESKDSMRNFLKNFRLHRELLDLEIKWGNFPDAAQIAKQMGDSLLEADLLSKCGVFQEASLIMLWYVFSKLTRATKEEYSPYHFKRKDDILEKAMATAKSHSDSFYDFACMEAVILSEIKSFEEIPESGLQFVRHWRQNVPAGLVKTSFVLDKTEQDLLERCAHRYYDLEDSETMMKFVEDFQSTALMRTFLKSVNCLHQLILLEEKNGNFLKAAQIAELKGDVLWNSDLLRKAGYFEEASLLILWYVFAESSWAQGNRGWPLRQFSQKQELLDKAKKSAENQSDQFYLFVCSEANILSHKHISLSEMGHYLYASPGQRSLRSEILASRRALDAHMNLLPSAYEWNGELVDNLREHVEDKIAQNQVSIETLVFLWDYWKDNILGLIQYLCREPGQYSALEDYIMNLFGLWKTYRNQEIVYVILNSGAKWVREINSTLLSRRGDSVCIALHSFVPVALNHLGSELFSVGIEVLDKLKILYTYCRNTSLTVFCQSSCLVHMFKIAKFLGNHKFPNREYFDNRPVNTYLKLSSGELYDIVFHVDCKKSMSKEMITLRNREVLINSLKEATLVPISVMNAPTTEQMGNLVTLMLGSGKQNLHLNNNIMENITRNQLWKELVEEINQTKELVEEINQTRSGFGPNSSISDLDGVSRGVSLSACIFALLKVFTSADCRSKQASVSPSCFMYLAERLLVMVSYFQGHFFVTKSACVEWLICEGWNVSSSPREMPLVLGDVHNVIASQIEILLLNKHDTLQWLESLNCNSEEYYRLLVLRLIVLLCLICVNSGKHFEKLFSLLDRKEICSELPGEFCNALGRRNCYFIDALSRAFVRIENQLVIVSLVGNIAECSCSNAIFLNKKKLSGNDLVSELFPDTCDTSTTRDHIEGGDLGRPYGLIWEIFFELVTLNEETGSLMQFMSIAPVIKVEVEKLSSLLSHTIAVSLEAGRFKNDEDLLMEGNVMVDELNQLSYALDIRNLCEENIQTVVEISKGLQSRRLKMEPFLDNLFMQMRQHSMHE